MNGGVVGPRGVARGRLAKRDGLLWKASAGARTASPINRYGRWIAPPTRSFAQDFASCHLQTHDRALYQALAGYIEVAMSVYLVDAVALGSEPALLDCEIQCELSSKTFRYIELEFPVVIDGDSAQPVGFYSTMFFRGADLLELKQGLSRVEADLRAGPEIWKTREFLPHFDSSLGRYEFEWVEEELERAPLMLEISVFLEVISRAIEGGYTVCLQGG